MAWVDSPSGQRLPTMAVFAIAAFLIPWLARDVIPLDVCFRLLLPPAWLVVWSLACLGTGELVMFPLRSSRVAASATVVLLSGSAGLALGGFLFAAAGIFKPVVLNGLLVSASLFGLMVLLRRRDSLEFFPEGLFRWPSLLILIPGFLTLVVLTTPPVMYDVLHYHLAFPDQWLRAGSFLEFPRESFSYYPAAHGMLFSYALAAIGPWGANAINWWMGLMGMLAAAELARRFGGRRAVPWAAACFFLTPAALEISGYATADLTVAAWTGAALLVLLGEDGAFPRPRALLLGGFLAGSAAAAKYLAMATVCIPLVLVLAFLGLRDRVSRSVLLKGVACVLIGVGLSLGPWLLRNAVLTGNPVYPYMHSVFGGAPSSLNLGRELERTRDISASSGRRIVTSIFAMIRRSFQPRAEGGILGVHWLLLLIVAAGIGSSSRMKWPLWIFLIAGCVVWGFLVQYVRFLLPALVAGAALAGAGMAALMRELGTVARAAVLLLVLFIFCVNATVLASPFFYQRLGVAGGQLDELQFRRNWDDRTDAVDFIRRRLPENARLLLVGELRSFGLSRRVLLDGPYHLPLLVEVARSCDSAPALAERLRAMGVNYLLVNRREMPRLAGLRKVEDYWSPAGARERELMRDFFDRFLEPLFEKDGVGVYRLQFPKSSGP